MEVSNFFSHGQSPAQLAIFITIFILCWNLENIFGVTANYGKWRHDRTNFLFMLPGALSQMLLGVLFVKVLSYENIHGLGLLPMLHLDSTFDQIVVVFIVLDRIRTVIMATCLAYGTGYSARTGTCLPRMSDSDWM